MAIQINSPGWRVRRLRTVATGRKVRRLRVCRGLPPEFLASGVPCHRRGHPRTRATVTHSRGGGRGTRPQRHGRRRDGRRSSPFVTRRARSRFTSRCESTSRGMRGPSEVRFQIAVRRRATRGLVDEAVKAIVISVAKFAADKAAGLLVARLGETLERRVWKQRGLREGWLKVSKDTLAARQLQAGRPVSPDRSLLLIHGTFSNAAAAYGDLATSDFFDRLTDTYGDRDLRVRPFQCQPYAGRKRTDAPRGPCPTGRRRSTSSPIRAAGWFFGTSSNGATSSVQLSRRFKLGRAVLVASPNDGTPLATPERWDETVGWLANVLELFPSQPVHDRRRVRRERARVACQPSDRRSARLAFHGSFGRSDGDASTTARAAGRRVFSARLQLPSRQVRSCSVCWMWASTSSSRPRTISSCRPKADGASIAPPPRSFRPVASGVSDQAGTWTATRSHTSASFAHKATTDFLVNALLGRKQPLVPIDPDRALPDRHRGPGRHDRQRSGPACESREQPAATDLVAGRPPASIDAVADHRHQRGPDVRARSADARALPGLQADRHRKDHGRVDRRRHEAIARHGRVPGHRRHASDLSSTSGRISRKENSCRAPKPSSSSAWAKRASCATWISSGRCVKPSSPGPSDSRRTRSTRRRPSSWPRRCSGAAVPSSRPRTPRASSRRASTKRTCSCVTIATDASGLPYVGELRLIELYLDRATDAWRSLRLQESATPGRYRSPRP